MGGNRAKKRLPDRQQATLPDPPPATLQDTRDEFTRGFVPLLPATLSERLFSVLNPDRGEQRERWHRYLILCRDESNRSTVAFLNGSPVLLPAYEDSNPISSMIDRPDEQLKDIFAQWDMTPQRVKAEVEQIDQERAYRVRWHQAYCGWLITEPAFRRDQQALIAQGILESGQPFEKGNDEAAVGSPVQPVPERHGEVLRNFRTRWCLGDWLGPDLPVPLDVRFGDTFDTMRIPESQWQSFRFIAVARWLPLRRETLTLLEDVVRRVVQTDETLPHLKEWHKLVQQPGNKSMEGYARLQRVCRWWNALDLLFPDVTKRKKTQIKKAFANHLGVSEDSIKRSFALMGKRNPSS